MEFSFAALCKLTLEHKPGATSSSHRSTDIRFDVSSNLDRSRYLNEKDLPHGDGYKAMTMCFIQGLVANIHAAHESKAWDSAQHLRYIIEELERGFASVPNVQEGTM